MINRSLNRDPELWLQWDEIVGDEKSMLNREEDPNNEYEVDAV